MRKLQNSELNRLTHEEFRQSEKIPVVLVLDNIRSRHNTGSVFRTSDAFRVSAIFLCGITATPPDREIHKTALGATESVEWHYVEQTIDALKELKANGFRLVGLEQTVGSTSLQEAVFTPGEKIAFIFGNEVNGIDTSILAEIVEFIEIPQFGTKHSFNISVTAGIVLWDYSVKMGLPCNQLKKEA